jgi:rhodanese-related sulfurtransferase
MGSLRERLKAARGYGKDRDRSAASPGSNAGRCAARLACRLDFPDVANRAILRTCSRLNRQQRRQLGMQIITLVRRFRFALAERLRTGMLAAIRRLVRARFADVTHLTTAQLAAWLADPQRTPPVLLDVRSAAEYAVSHLPGAQRIDPECTADEVIAKVPADRSWVMYCSVGYRSSHLAQRVLQAGVTTAVSNLDGAIFCWVREGRALDSDRPTVQVHPYSRIAAKLLRPEHRAPLAC